MLTSERRSGIKSGYWPAEKKYKLVQKPGKEQHQPKAEYMTTITEKGGAVSMPLNTITVHLVSPRAASTAAAELRERLIAVRVGRHRIERLHGANTDILPALLREEADIIEAIKKLEGERL